MFLSMIIPDPNSLGWNIDTCVYSLIDELKHLSLFITLTYDVLRKHDFQMKVALI
jgi:hypothetical protein